MKTAKKLLILLVIVLGLGMVACGIGALGARHRYLTENVFMADGTRYSRDLEVIDLRGQDVDVGYYDELRSLLPETPILWEVPFQGGRLDPETAELTLTTLTDADVDRLD